MRYSLHQNKEASGTRKQWKTIAILLILLFLLVGCTKEIEQPLDTEQETETADNSVKFSDNYTTPIPEIPYTEGSISTYELENGDYYFINRILKIQEPQTMEYRPTNEITWFAVERIFIYERTNGVKVYKYTDMITGEVLAGPDSDYSAVSRGLLLSHLEEAYGTKESYTYMEILELALENSIAEKQAQPLKL